MSAKELELLSEILKEARELLDYVKSKKPAKNVENDIIRVNYKSEPELIIKFID